MSFIKALNTAAHLRSYSANQLLRRRSLNGFGIFVFPLVVILSAIPLGADEPAEAVPKVKSAEIRKAVQLSLPYLAKRGQWWIDKKECMSCHRTSFTAWSHIEASAAGVEVDAFQVNDWIDWNHENLFSAFPEKDQKHPGEKTIERNLSGAAQMLALAKNWKLTDSQKAFQRKIVSHLKAGQQVDGHWAPQGQLPFQRRDLDETAQVITLWNALSLTTAANAEYLDKLEIDAMIAAAEKAINQYEDGKSSEWLSLRVLFATRRGDDNRSRRFRQRLFKMQNADGGWGWIAGNQSDALATAQVVFTLLESGSNVDCQQVKTAIRFLLKTQTQDGSWKVTGTKAKAKGKVTETASYWGSAWACIALSRSLKSIQQVEAVRISEQ